MMHAADDASGIRRVTVLLGDALGGAAVILGIPIAILSIGIPIALVVRLLLWVTGQL
jgi:hypothetical protein